jgi:hypothetical protein
VCPGPCRGLGVGGDLPFGPFHARGQPLVDQLPALGAVGGVADASLVGGRPAVGCPDHGAEVVEPAGVAVAASSASQWLRQV